MFSYENLGTTHCYQVFYGIPRNLDRSSPKNGLVLVLKVDVLGDVDAKFHLRKFLRQFD